MVRFVMHGLNMFLKGSYFYVQPFCVMFVYVGGEKRCGY